MPTVREFFVTEATERLDALTAALGGAGAASVDPAELHRLARGLRGSAQMGRERHVERVARTLEAVARAVARHDIGWSDELRERARQTVADLRALTEGVGGEADAERRVETAIARWHGLGLPLPASRKAGGGGADGPDARRDAQPTDAGTGTLPPADVREFAAREAAAVLGELTSALPVLERRPREREPLKAILRCQRALLGASSLDDLPVLAETVRAIDDVTRLVARRDAAVRGPWLEFYRAARAVLQEVSPQIAGRGASSSPGPSFGRLRSVRDRLVREYGEEEDRRPASAPDAESGSAEERELFRGEARTLLDRMERMARGLASAPERRRNALRRELREALTAMRDNARTFGLTAVAEAADGGLARIGAGDATEALVVVDRMRETIGLPTDDATEVVPIETLCYQGDAALRRVLELRERLESAVDDPEARDLLAEVYDLIRYALE